MIDTHAHLDACDEAPDALLARARAAGVTRVVTIGTGIESCRRGIELANEHEGVFVAVGIDPHQASKPEAARVDELRELTAHPRVVAIGETGLDGFHTFATILDQQLLLARHLELATETGLPVVIHSRDAEHETAAALASFSGTVILHCFSSPALLKTAIERGYYVSYAGNVTFPKAVDLRATVSSVPAERLLVETDSPYLSPVPHRGRPNEPARAIDTLAVLAAERGVAYDDLGRTIDANATRAFGL
ncbi:MAG: TatD family hydrolase [Gaiellales bacterium]